MGHTVTSWPLSIAGNSSELGEVIPPGERRSKTPIQLPGMKRTNFWTWLARNLQDNDPDERRKSNAGGLDCRYIPGLYRCLTVPQRNSWCGFRHFFSCADSCVRLLLGKCMPEAEIREWLEALHNNMQAVKQLLSRRRCEKSMNNWPLNPHMTLGGARPWFWGIAANKGKVTHQILFCKELKLQR
jgi:hypothetical protein